MTEIKLSPAMVTALKGAEVREGRVLVPDATKAQTVKGLEARGLMGEATNELNAEGVEAARQLGNDTATYNQPAPEETQIDTLNAILRDDTTKGEGITPEMVDQAATNLLKTPEQLAQITDLDKPHVVPNRADKRRAKFSIRAAISRHNERKRARKAAKYGDTHFGVKAD